MSRSWPRAARRALAFTFVALVLIAPGIFPRPAKAAGEDTGSIFIVQSTVPEGPQAFFYDSDIPEIHTFALDDDSDATLPNQVGSENISPGEYLISQSLPLGWTLLGVSCTDPDGGTNTLTNGAIIDLDAAEEITCTFNNSPSTGDVVIHLESIPEDPIGISFDGDLGAFTLADDGNEIDDMTWNTITVSGLLPGTYTVNQQLAPGFDLTLISCSDPDGGTIVDLAGTDAVLDVDAGEAIDCTFTNESTSAPPPPPPPGGDFHVVLDAIPDNSVDVAFTAEALPFSLDDDPSDGALSNQFDRYDMDLGPWDVQATIPTGWQVKSVACSDPDHGSTTDKTNARAVIDLDAGEDVTCTFTIEPKPAAPPATKCNGKDATIVAAAGVTAIRGTQGPDVIVALNGNVRVDARGGNDTICAGSGDNIINGGAGDDWIDGGAGTNTIDLGTGTNTAFAGGGNDTIVGGSGNDTASAGDGNNLVSLAGGNDVIVTGSGDDRISGGKGFDTCQPGGGTNAVRDCEG